MEPSAARPAAFVALKVFSWVALGVLAVGVAIAGYMAIANWDAIGIIR